MILADLLAEALGNLLGNVAGALIRAGRNVQWRNTARLRPIRPVWLRLWRRAGGR